MIRTSLTQHDRHLISLRRREPDNYVDFCASPPSWSISKMLEGRYTRTLLGPAGDAVLSSVWPCDIHCGGPTFAVLRRRASTMQIWFIYRASLWHAFAPLSQRVDPQIPSHGAAPRLTNAPVYKGYLSSGSSTGAEREEVAPEKSPEITGLARGERRCERRARG